MNRYPVWKYAILVIVLLVGVLYTLPNFFGEAPAVQVSSAKATVKVDAAVQQRVEEALTAAGLSPDFVSLEGGSVRARFDTPDNQLKAKDALQKALVPDANDASYIVALNLVSRSPTWLKAIHANPMYLGLALILLGLAVYLASPWALLGPLVFAAYITRFQIVPEERALQTRFGAAYTAYRARVRRWL